jgi:calcineurin-like phosphoesterase family protein
MEFFTSDTHFFDENLIGRPNDFAPERADFFRVEDMNETIINHWDQVVSDQDTVYHLGDLAVYYRKGSIDQVIEILERLNFKKMVLVKGNHDSRDELKKILNSTVGKKIEVNDVGVYFKANHHQFYLTHYPMLLGVVPNIINLHGHLHHHAVSFKENLNIGIDSNELDYLPSNTIKYGQPLSMEQIEFMYRAKRDDYLKRR